MKPEAATTEVPAREPDGQFSTFDTWLGEATARIGGTNALCVDAAGRVCATFGDMVRARDDGAFPVFFWHGEGNQTPEQQEESRRMARIVWEGRWPGVLF